MHSAIFDNILRLRLLWGHPLATKLGIELPARKPNAAIGLSGLYHIPNKNNRHNIYKQLLTTMGTYERSTEQSLQNVLHQDAQDNFTTFTTIFTNRFQSTIEDTGWFTKASLDIITYLHDSPPLVVEQHLALFKVTLQTCIDQLSNFLIVYALPHAIHANRHLLKEIFLSDLETGALSFQIPHFDISCKVRRNDVLESSDL